MTQVRLTQNFADFHATIISISDVTTLVSILSRLGVRATVLPGVRGTILHILPLLRRDQDFIIIDCDTEAAAELVATAPPVLSTIPVIGLLNGESPSRLKTMLRLGATAIIRHPVHGATIYPALFLGINAHRRRLQADTEIEDLERRRRSRRSVAKATMQRMHTHGLSDDEAYEALRREAMQSRQSIEDYCDATLGGERSFVFIGAVMVG